MTVEEFESWLNEKISDLESVIKIDRENHYEVEISIEVQKAYKDVLKKYKSILPPPTTLN